MQAPGYTLVPEADGSSLRGADGRVGFTYLTKKPAGSNLKANSACCFHPLNTPSGERITDLAPGDHVHHRGVFLAWHAMEFRWKADFSKLGPLGPTHVFEPRNLNAPKHRVEFLPDFVCRMLSAANETEEEINVGFEKTQAIDGLHEISLGPAAEFVRDNQGLDVLDDRLTRVMLAQPRADNPRASKRMEAFVLGITQGLDHGLFGTRKRALHVVRQGREPHRLGRARCDTVEPFERFQKVVPIVRIPLDDPGASGVDQWRFHYRACTFEHMASSPFAIASANGASLM